MSEREIYTHRERNSEQSRMNSERKSGYDDKECVDDGMNDEQAQPCSSWPAASARLVQLHALVPTNNTRPGANTLAHTSRERSPLHLTLRSMRLPL